MSHNPDLALHADKLVKLVKLVSREDMVNRGAYGFLSMGVECEVPIKKIVALTSGRACENWGTYSAVAKDHRVMEAKYSAEDDVFLLFNGARCLEEANEAGIQWIRAFVEPDQGSLGPVSKILGENYKQRAAPHEI